MLQAQSSQCNEKCAGHEIVSVSRCPATKKNRVNMHRKSTATTNNEHRVVLYDLECTGQKFVSVRVYD